MSANAISDDEIMRRRLLMDGEGMGDDKRLTTLYKQILKWGEVEEDSEEEMLINHSRLAALTEACELSMTRSVRMQKVFKEEAENYEHACEDMEARISEIQKDVEEKRVILERSLRLRLNQKTYNKLAASIKTYPERDATLAKLEEIEKGTQNLENKKQKLVDQLDKRSKMLCALQLAANELKAARERVESSESEDDMPISL